jgi:hypothetical protein
MRRLGSRRSLQRSRGYRGQSNSNRCALTLGEPYGVARFGPLSVKRVCLLTAPRIRSRPRDERVRKPVVRQVGLEKQVRRPIEEIGAGLSQAAADVVETSTDPWESRMDIHKNARLTPHGRERHQHNRGTTRVQASRRGPLLPSVCARAPLAPVVALRRARVPHAAVTADIGTIGGLGVTVAPCSAMRVWRLTHNSTTRPQPTLSHRLADAAG